MTVRVGLGYWRLWVWGCKLYPFNPYLYIFLYMFPLFQTDHLQACSFVACSKSAWCLNLLFAFLFVSLTCYCSCSLLALFQIVCWSCCHLGANLDFPFWLKGAAICSVWVLQVFEASHCSLARCSSSVHGLGLLLLQTSSSIDCIGGS